MDKEELMPADEFCAHYEVEYTFIGSLVESGLIEITTIDQRNYIHTHQMSDIEKFIHMHYDLDINMEGIEAIAHLLQRIHEMQHEITFLKNRVTFLKER
ncbi:MAG TPA: chaperone modulator CbpM [Flavisolibacter sp.]|nr:chaperone modulator CbpM [Flavisolibacter sp.]